MSEVRYVKSIVLKLHGFSWTRETVEIENRKYIMMTVRQDDRKEEFLVTGIKREDFIHGKGSEMKQRKVKMMNGRKMMQRRKKDVGKREKYSSMALKQTV